MREAAAALQLVKSWPAQSGAWCVTLSYVCSVDIISRSKTTSGASRRGMVTAASAIGGVHRAAAIAMGSQDLMDRRRPKVFRAHAPPKSVCVREHHGRTLALGEPANGW